MVSDIFFRKYLDLELNEQKCTDSFVLFLISKLIYNEGPKYSSEIYKYLVPIYGDAIKITKLKMFLDSNFVECGRYLFRLSKDSEAVFSKCTYLNQKFDYFNNLYTKDELINLLNTNYFCNYHFDVIKALGYISIIILKDNNIERDIQDSNFYYYVLNMDSYMRKLEEEIESISSHYLNLPINTIFKNELILKFLYLNNINNLNDLKKASLDFLFSIFFIDFEYSYEILKSLSDSNLESINTKIDSFFDLLNDKAKFILFKRNGIDCDAKTLEEIGKECSLTRERVRQIEIVNEKTLIDNSNLISTDLYAVFYHLLDKEKSFVEYEDFLDFFKSREMANKYCFLVYLLPLFIKYDVDIKIVYDSNVISLEEIENNFLNNYENTISLDTFNSLKEYEKNFVNKYYRLVKDQIYIRKGLSFNNVICFVIDENFPNGYKIGSDNDYNKLKQIYFDKFGYLEDFPSQRALAGLIDRFNYCQIDKGTYKNRNSCVTLPNDLIDKIISYILSNGPTVFYISIFEEFKDEFLNLGINNYFYLKGLIDPFLPKDFITKRNF